MGQTPETASEGREVKPLPKHWVNVTEKMITEAVKWMETVLGDFNELRKVKIRYDIKERAWIIEMWAYDLLLQKNRKVMYKYESEKGDVYENLGKDMQ